ncbi:MAG: hypothetical protein IT381_15115 [Deltaproteobacteria bacterium]|nr:hypothetical protein [Deltaproteobacteria bacterium]
MTRAWLTLAVLGAIVCVGGCRTAPVTPRVEPIAPIAAAQTSPIEGMPGAQGPSGGTRAYQGSDYVGAASGVLSLVVPSACDDGDVLKVVGSALACGAEETSVDSLFAMSGLSRNVSTGDVTVSALLGSGAGQFSPGDHRHFGQTFSGSSSNPGLVVDVRGSGPRGIGVRSRTPATFDGNGYLMAPGAAVFGDNTAANGGVGVYGDASIGASGGDSYGVGVQGYAEGTNARGVVGEAAGTGGAGVRGVATQVQAAGVRAEHQAFAGALRVEGKVDFSAGGVILPLQTRTQQSGPGAAGSRAPFADCGVGFFVVSGGCRSDGTMTDSYMADTQTECTNGTQPAASMRDASGVNVTSGFGGFCCRFTSATIATAVAICLRVN